MAHGILASIREHNWRQGDIFPQEAHSILAEQLGIELTDDCACIVITHSCSILHEHFEQEPVIEILVARPSDKLDGNAMYVRNPRRLHFSLSVTGQAQPFEVWAKDRYRLTREILAKYRPDTNRNFEKDSLLTLVAWLVARYERAAFPDNFQKRLAQIKSKLKSQFEKLCDVSEVFIALSSWDELDINDPYKVVLVFIMPAHKFEQSELRAQATIVMAKIDSLLTGCQGIQLAADSELRSDDNFTLHEIRQMSRWGDFDYVSYRDMEGHEIPGAT